MKKFKFIIISALSALTLASCSLFNDDDIKIENNFNPKQEAAPEATTGGVASSTITLGTTEALVFNRVIYSNLEEDGVKKIKNNYKTFGETPFKFNINSGQDYVVTKEHNNFDLYVPKGLNKNQAQTVVLFLHGGAWVSGAKTHVNSYVQEFTKRGYISVTPEYTLLNRDFNTEHPELSIFRDLDEIDACITTIKSCLTELGFTGGLNLVIGGASSGAHLAMLYSYSRGSNSAMPIRFIINAVGPTDIREDVWMAFNYSESEAAAYETALEKGIDAEQIGYRESESKLKRLQVSGETYNWTQYQTMKIANGMCGFQFSPSEVESSAIDSTFNEVDTSSDVYAAMIKDGVNETGEDLLSVTHYMTNSNKIPMICAYGGKDSIIGIKQYANLESRFIAKSYVKDTDYCFFYFKDCGHVDIESNKEQYNAFINKIENWLKTK